MVLATDGDKSFLLFSYGDIQWSGGGFIGFISPITQLVITDSGINSFENIETTSNVGIPGLYIYRVDQEDVIEPSLRTPGT